MSIKLQSSIVFITMGLFLNTFGEVIASLRFGATTIHNWWMATFWLTKMGIFIHFRCSHSDWSRLHLGILRGMWPWAIKLQHFCLRGAEDTILLQTGGEVRGNLSWQHFTVWDEECPPLMLELSAETETGLPHGLTYHVMPSTLCWFFPVNAVS